LPPLLTPITSRTGGNLRPKAPAWEAKVGAAAGQSELRGRAAPRSALQSYADPRARSSMSSTRPLENLGLAEVIRAFELMKVDPDEAVLPALRRARKSW